MHNGAVLLQAQSKSKGGRTILAALFAAAALAAALPGPAHAREFTEAQATLPKTQLSAGIHIIQAEVANTEETRERGLMFRKRLDGNDGMLFVFEQPDKQCFWMHNTPLPLSIAFIADDGTIVNIEDMAPQSDDTHCSRKAVRYALEMAQGWFADHGITAGKKIDGLP
ncbi:DUF192 domain-containing protein [Bordetella bronchialis]|uniref:DUF192 domain-containing protein n=1 Tax=Bordetella bronchialis TaxID=463025 RepID=UPI003D02CDE4